MSGAECMFTELTSWLNLHFPLADYQIFPLPGDASFRRYYRIKTSTHSFIAMDARTEKASCVPFVAIAKLLRENKVHAPEIIASDVSEGFLLLTDFGDRSYLKELSSSNADRLYKNALNTLIKMQGAEDEGAKSLKLFDAPFMYQELNLFSQWFLINHLSLSLSDATVKMLQNCFAFLAETAANQPRVFMHRDYHSANLMCLPNEEVGVLDFQDAFIGPITYDLVSLLRDCYISWPTEKVTQWVNYFWERLPANQASFPEFFRWFELMGIQRHLKALLTFSRKYRRDGNPNYLQYIPRTLNYILTASRNYPECQPLYDFLKEQVIEKCVP